LFTWDTMSGLTPEDYANPVLVDADPTGAETNGLLADLERYLPTRQAWADMLEYRTRQTLTVTTAYIPASWHRIERDNPKRLADGTTAVTIEGIRHRYGTWLGEPHTSDHEVAFTIFLTCPPTHDRCHTLRLSRLDNPLR
ncbi:MAG: hypothetical protein ACRD0P_31495, partial [Stackebrandtia sp.]